ncbi:hypothetical protein [Vibrio crassostreae]|uniref:DNA-binding transcriptional repressor CapW winged helix-turn-helix domain-containing protein n=1 Tax=Vibrio crassostreae TaxID=246167 RepID=A0ABM9QP49_9VIBR|nr:hypothetical protein [Vibrio crassostreae]TCL30253.1 hypothetical protein EDB52_101538 [Vibrio crassostreae]TCT53612.1 hypothetical protein EDB39_101680 [Vibrio crassostreae]TCT62076.1 hypothetical protein EDB40_102127 [Vibrio crassostreae]CAK1700866.1 hypothetical protein VCRA2116O30_100087 [Vibrio crassostreae]CAK1701047.1 hypothetical protein VCRA2119O45_100087 [Vibrio crassostreae]
MNLNELLVKKYIEASLVTNGRINTTMITKAFGCGRQHASKMIGRYSGEFPGTIEYTPSGKGAAYTLVNSKEDFKPAYIDDACDFIRCLEVVLD